jgi:uncharacterized protein with HEPN domain
MKDERVYLAHILECIEKIQRYTHAGRESFFKDSLIQDGVCNNLTIIGEAANKTSQDFRKKFPDIHWRGMIGLRNVLIHDYEGIDLRQVWQVIEVELPKLKTSLLPILPPLDQLEIELSGEKHEKKK